MARQGGSLVSPSHLTGRYNAVGLKPKVKYGARSPKFICAPVYSCTHWLRPRNSPPPPTRIWAHIRGLYWSAKTDDISL